MARETLLSLTRRSALAGRTAIVTGASGAARAPRDVASTTPGTAALRLARHAPGLVDRAVAARVHRLARGGAFSAAALASGLRERHAESHAPDKKPRP